MWVPRENMRRNRESYTRLSEASQRHVDPTELHGSSRLRMLGDRITGRKST